MAQKREIYNDLKSAIKTAGITYQTLELMNDAEVRVLIGARADGLSGTFIQNMQRKAVEQMKHKEMKSVADWIVSRVSGQFPNVEAIPRRDRTIRVYLDGIPEVIE